jgi:hypothetical protein
MADPETSTRPCPFCKEAVNAAALRCRHCQASIAPAGPTHGGVCPYCKEHIHPEAVRCKHCRSNLGFSVSPALSIAQAPQKWMTQRSYRRRHSAHASLKVAAPHASEDAEVRAATCPPAILDSSPDGTGLGVWVLVESDAHYCTYEYAGGIA